MPIVENGRSVTRLLQPHVKQDCKKMTVGFHLTGHDYAKVNGKRRRLHLSSTNKKRTAQISDDLTLVCNHFGLSMTESLTVALHIAANAIRKNRAVPDIS